MAQIIDGRLVSGELKKGIKARANAFETRFGKKAHLAVILVGNDPASCIYVRNKQRACEKAGIEGETIVLDEHADEQELLDLIVRLNADTGVNGILVQMPLPPHLDAERIIEHIDPIKDVDGLHSLNAGRLFKDRALLEPCTPKGCMELLCYYGVTVSGRNAAVVGRSVLVGKPVAVMLERANATVTLCHSRTRDLKAVLSQADIVVAAVGKPRLITGEMLKPGAAVLDVGINRLEDGTITGDVDFESASEAASFITPVPGGVGPMTIAMLLENTIIAAEAQNA